MPRRFSRACPVRFRSCVLLAILALALPDSAPASSPELRGVWMHASQMKTRADAEQCVRRIEAAHLNAVFLLVWYWGGQAYYHSELCPMAAGVEPGHDPLAWMIRECHHRQIQVHAWFVNGAYGASRPRRVLDQHPDWAVDSGGNAELWYDLGKPEVRRFESDLMIEALRNYDLDGVHFDYIRYNGPAECYCPHCQREFADRYGFEPIDKTRLRSFPLVTTVSANPVAEPTTAQVLARFSDGTPAIATNALGRGSVLLLNWHAARPMQPAVGETIQRTMRAWQAPADRVFVMDTAPNRARYGRAGAHDAAQSLEELGYRARVVPEDRLEKLPRDAVLVLASVYLIPDDFAQSLAKFVEEGGKLVVIDGPVFAMRQPSIQKVLGMSRTASYFNRIEVIKPAAANDLLATADVEINLDKERTRKAKWAEYRKAGVTELVRDVYRRAKDLKPDALVTAAVFTPLSSAENVFQDWPGWLREGIVDYVVPMAYTLENKELDQQLREWKTVDPRLERVVPGLSVYKRAGEGTTSRDPDLVLSQHELCLSHGAPGNVYFSLGNLSDAIGAALVAKHYPTKVPAYRPSANRR